MFAAVVRLLKTRRNSHAIINPLVEMEKAFRKEKKMSGVKPTTTNPAVNADDKVCTKRIVFRRTLISGLFCHIRQKLF